jgi:hypothetical protein
MATTPFRRSATIAKEPTTLSDRKSRPLPSEVASNGARRLRTPGSPLSARTGQGVAPRPTLSLTMRRPRPSRTPAACARRSVARVILGESDRTIERGFPREAVRMEFLRPAPHSENDLKCPLRAGDPEAATSSRVPVRRSRARALSTVARERPPLDRPAGRHRGGICAAPPK